MKIIMKTCRFLVSVPFVLAALVVSLALGADTASAAEPRIVGEWRFSGTGDERLKATVGRDLVKYTRTGDPSLDLAGGDGIRLGDGYLRAGQNSGLKCFHGLPKDSSYTVVMDVRVPTGPKGSYFALFQPDPDNDSDCRYYLRPGSSATRLRFWVASLTHTDDVADRDAWIRVAFTYEHGEYKTLYVNGEKVFVDTLNRSGKNRVETTLHLRKGPNEIRIRVDHSGWQRQFAFDLAPRAGDDLQSLRYVAPIMVQ